MTDGYPPEDPEITEQRIEKLTDEYDRVERAQASFTAAEVGDPAAFADDMVAEVETLSESDHCEAVVVAFGRTDHAEYGYLHCQIYAALADDAPGNWLANAMRELIGRYGSGGKP